MSVRFTSHNREFTLARRACGFLLMCESCIGAHDSWLGCGECQLATKTAQRASCKLQARSTLRASSPSCTIPRLCTETHTATTTLRVCSLDTWLGRRSNSDQHQIANRKSQIANATMKSQTRHSPLHMTLLFATCVIFVLQPRRARFGVRHALTVRRLRSPNSPRVTSESCAITRLIVGDLHSQPPFTPPIHSSTCTLHSSKSAFGSNT